MCAIDACVPHALRFSVWRSASNEWKTVHQTENGEQQQNKKKVGCENMVNLNCFELWPPSSSCRGLHSFCSTLFYSLYVLDAQCTHTHWFDCRFVLCGVWKCALAHLEFFPINICCDFVSHTFHGFFSRGNVVNGINHRMLYFYIIMKFVGRKNT